MSCKYECDICRVSFSVEMTTLVKILHSQISPAWNAIALEYLDRRNRKRRHIDRVYLVIKECGELSIWLRLSAQHVGHFGLEGWFRIYSNLASAQNVSVFCRAHNLYLTVSTLSTTNKRFLRREHDKTAKTYGANVVKQKMNRAFSGDRIGSSSCDTVELAPALQT